MHLSWAELACHDAARTAYPAEWRADRAVLLAAEFEALRALAEVPLFVASGYRTREHNRAVGGARASQHCEGRALDLMPARGVTVDQLFALARARARDPRSAIRGIGQYARWVHIDVRPGDRLVTWRG